MQHEYHVAIVGGGPSGLFMYKRLIEKDIPGLQISIFESRSQVGAGMPYSYDGACVEHMTNVSDHEIPKIGTPIHDYIQLLSFNMLKTFGIDPKNFNKHKVVPRLLFGQYLSDQFTKLKQYADLKGIKTQVHLASQVTDIRDIKEQKKVKIMVGSTVSYLMDQVIICTGHRWPTMYEGNIEHYFESPYPPSKLAFKVNHAVGIKGASLTAIDAIRTIARHNGNFEQYNNGHLTYHVDAGSENFKIVMHTRRGLLPAIRFHQEDPFLANRLIVTEEEIMLNRAENEGFVSLDFLFERNFKAQFKEKDPSFYAIVEELTLEEFVEVVLDLREQKEPFACFQQEYEQSLQSISKRQSIYWKEVLSALSFTLNYPAKYMSAEDMLRLKKVLMPLISIVIAFVPQESSQEILALHAAERLDIVSVGSDSKIEPDVYRGARYYYTNEVGEDVEVHYQTFIDCTGQPHLSYRDFPFKSMVEDGSITPAYLQFRSATFAQQEIEAGNDQVFETSEGLFYMQVPGIKIEDHFQIVDKQGDANDRIYMMAVPYIGGYNPDYSGLDFCSDTSAVIADRIVEQISNKL